MNQRRHGNNEEAGMSQNEAKPGLNARQTATKLLSAVVDRATSLDGLLDAANGNPAFRGLSDADKGLVRAILLATLRHLPIIEAVLASLVEKPLPAGARALNHVLNIAAAQIIYLEVPDHAAVDIAVEQANRDPRNRRFASLVNAVLRRLVREKTRLLPQIEATTINAPQWFYQRLQSAYGARAQAILAAQACEPSIDLTVKSDPQHWADLLGGIVLPTGSVRLGKVDGSITALPGFADGQWWVQDVAASIPAKLFGNIEGKNIADLCAAPGGKTAQLILAGAKVSAVDLSRNRLKRLSENLARLGYEADIIETDLLKWQPDGLYDGVLLDAPCSSTGTVRRHPDIPWTKNLADIEKLAELQEKMLRHAAILIKPGGVIVFSNCSLDPLEGEDMVERVLASRTDLKRRPVLATDWPGLETAITDRGDIRTTPDMLPHEIARLSGMDGFFASVLVRHE